ncbi:uncharacterized protein LOC105699003 [Orussus abietinus]|uniref:uncharacterized protein LOC105699003 n=1 Tax=Orussus abietinus TaxID=222816 RepID=UPI00062505BD|nr:uncharacterized protein LOC105699003 [Orussus abietinus]XP_012279106.1 uncharacterized protein LOC105699003 [Orussus abietinus]
MALRRLGFLKNQYKNAIQLTHRDLTVRCLSNGTTIKKDTCNDEDLDAPIKYSTSEAATWEAKHSLRNVDDDTLWYQSHVVTVSVAVFLIYFLMLREENDIDRLFDRDMDQCLEDTKREVNH